MTLTMSDRTAASFDDVTASFDDVIQQKRSNTPSTVIRVDAREFHIQLYRRHIR
jgi:hypothetical protein